MKPKVVICRGLPGSGKSTWSRQFVRTHKNWARVCKQDIRRDVFENPDEGFDGKDNFAGRSDSVVCRISDVTITSLLEVGYSVIIDGINLNPNSLSRLKTFIGKRASVRIKNFTEVPLSLCLDRNSRRSREHPVSSVYIRRLARLYLKGE